MINRIEKEDDEHCFELKNIGLPNTFLFYENNRTFIQWSYGKTDITDDTKKKTVLSECLKKPVLLDDEDPNEFICLTMEQVVIVNELIDLYITNRKWPV